MSRMYKLIGLILLLFAVAFGQVSGSPGVTGTATSFYPPDAQSAKVHRKILSTSSATVMGAYGDSVTTAGNAYTDTPPAGSEPDAFTSTTTATSGNVASMYGGLLYLPGRNTWFSGYVSPSATTSIRLYIGLTNTSIGNTLASDAPSSYHYAGFLFTTDGAVVNGTTFDSVHFYCIANNGGTTPTIAITSVSAAAGVGHKFDISENTSTGHWYFYIDGVQVADFTTTLPTLVQRQAAGVATLTTATKAVNLSWLETWSDK